MKENYEYKREKSERRESESERREQSEIETYLYWPTYHSSLSSCTRVRMKEIFHFVYLYCINNNIKIINKLYIYSIIYLNII
jgi:hypothetical protein